MSPARRSPTSRARRTGGRRRSADVTRRSDAMDLETKVFRRDLKQIARPQRKLFGRA